MHTVYAVQYIEVEFGQRDEGYKVYSNLDECIKQTEEDSRNGAYEGGGGYFGPERPLYYYEVPIDCLDDEDKKAVIYKGRCFTDRRWQPKFKSNAKSILEAKKERAAKRKKIADAIKEAEEEGLYEISEHLSGAGVWLGEDDEALDD